MTDVKRVQEILLMPIVEINRIKNTNELKIEITENGEINSTQLYSAALDCDMSDFAVGFYQTIYEVIIPDQVILKEDKSFNDDNFAGDTMNSFNRTAGKAYKEGINGKEDKEHFVNVGKHRNDERRSIKNYDNWPKHMQQYHKIGCCLANFWILPMDLGRTGIGDPINKMLNARDYMDMYLLRICYEKVFEEPPEKYAKYFDRANFNGFEDFCNKHFINSYLNENNTVIKYSYISDSEKIVDEITKRIHRRAEDISKEYANHLWGYFKNRGLV